MWDVVSSQAVTHIKEAEDRTRDIFDYRYDHGKYQYIEEEEKRLNNEETLRKLGLKRVVVVQS